MENKVRIKMGIIEFEAEGDADFIERERQQFFSLLPQAITDVSPVVNQNVEYVEAVENLDQIESTAIPKIESKDKKNIENDSILSFLNSKNFSTDVETVMGVAYYIDSIENKQSFTSKDIEEKIAEARRPKLSNVASFIKSNVNKKFLQEIPDKIEGRKVYTVLNDGIIWCENYKSNSVETTKKGNGKKSSSTKQRQKAISPLLSIGLDELNLANYCDITEIDGIDDQVIVMMYIYSKEKSIDNFKYSDVVDVFKTKFRIPITERQVRYIFDKGGMMFDKSKEGGKVVHKLMMKGVSRAEEIISEYNK